jgi:SAM-dependent methyltransferase
MHVPVPIKEALRRTPLYPAYRWLAPRARSARDRSRRALADWRRTLRGEPPPAPALPPTSLIFLVAGGEDPEWFLRSGKMGADSIRAILEKNGIDLGGMRAILDFGCGVGRVMRHWSDLRGPRVYGCDYNPRLVDWCRQNLTFAEVRVNALQGGLPYASGMFDLVYALSVFTHLTPAQEDFWMEELGRILRPGGHLLITTHGEHYLGSLPPEYQAEFRAGRRLITAGEQAGTNMCATYHPPEYVRAHTAARYEVVDFEPEGAKGNPWQDYWLLRKPL